MDALPRVPFAALSRACAAFAPAQKIGEGATGEVFRGRLDGADVALKRLHLPEGATPEAKAALVRAFNAELATLSAYRHPRIVRLLTHFCTSTKVPYRQGLNELLAPFLMLQAAPSPSARCACP